MSIRPPSLTFLRAFSSTSTASAKSSASRLAHDHKNIPPYPYGPSQWYKQSNFGLYGGTRIRFGNNVSEHTEIKTRRKWHPNIRRKSLYSVALRKSLRLRVSARVLRTIDKVGGLDEYLLGEKPMRLKELGMGGWRLRWRVMQTESVKARFAEERKRLGLPEQKPKNIASDGRVVSEREVQEEIESYDKELDEEQRKAAEEETDEDEDLGTGFVKDEQAPKKSSITL